MYVTGLGTATPPQRYTKAECLHAFERADWFGRLDERAHQVPHMVLQRDNGIDTRHLAVATLDEVFQINPDPLTRRSEVHAPALAAQAGEPALQHAGLGAQLIDAVVVSTCTGYLYPGLSTYVVERLGLRPDVQAFYLVGQGCAGAAQHVLSVCAPTATSPAPLSTSCLRPLCSMRRPGAGGGCLRSAWASAATAPCWRCIEMQHGPCHQLPVRSRL
jgi:predicted naringenin-chalcone synthase